MLNFRRITGLLVMFLMAFGVFAQSRVVSGNVKSDLGTVISGVQVSLKGSSAATQTNEQGEFVLMVSGESAVLVFELDGYTSEEVSVGNRSNVDVSMFVLDLMALSFEDLMNTMISSSSFFNLRSKDTPGYVFSLNMDEMSTPKSLSSIIRMVVPGASDGAHRDSDVMGVRGMKVVDNSKTLVMFDGQSLNQRANMGYSLGFSSPLMGDVKTIEVGLSPNAIVHGSGAINGYINMVPKNGYDNSGFAVRATNDYTGQKFGESEFNLVEMGYGVGNTARRNAFFYAGWYQHPGFTPDSSLTINEMSTLRMAGENVILTDNLQHTSVGNTYLPNIKMSTHLNFDGFNFNAGYQQIYRSTNLNQQQNFQRIMNLRPKYGFMLSEKESVDLIAGAEFYDLGIINTALAESLRYGGRESHVEGKFVVKSTRFKNNSLAFGALVGERVFDIQKQYFGSDLDEAGLQYYIDPKTGRNNTDELFWASGQMPAGKWRETAVFIEDIYEVNRNLTISAGLRYDNFFINEIEKTQSNLAPRIAASYSFNQNSVLKASYQQGFRTVDLYHLYQTMYNRLPQINFANSSGNGNLNPRLEEEYNANLDMFSVEISPEQLESFEVSYQYSLFNSKLNFDVNAYYNIYKNTIDYIPLVRWSTARFLEDENYKGDIVNPGTYFTDEALYNWTRPGSGDRARENYTNERGMAINMADDITIVGSEVIVNYRPLSGTHIRAVYGYAKSLDDLYQDNSTFPLHQVKLSATHNLFNNKMVVNSLFLFEPGIKENETTKLNYHDVYFTDRTLLDFTLGYNINRNVTLSGSAVNVLGENNPGLLFKPVPVDNSVNTSTEYLGLGRDKTSFMLTLTVKM